jgi:hypothetical protein
MINVGIDLICRPNGNVLHTREVLGSIVGWGTGYPEIVVRLSIGR